MLVANDIEVTYGAVAAVRGVSVNVKAGEILAVLGPNGAGKTSLLRAISGLGRSAGTVAVDGVDIDTPEKALSRGVVHVPQGRGLFRKLTVAQNITLVGDVAEVSGQIPEIAGWTRRTVGSLSGGEQVLVALSRLIAAKPRFALIDELSLGLAPIARDRVEDELRALRDSGAGLIVVDQHAPRALALADRVVVLERGETVIDSTSKRVSVDRIAQLTVGVGR